MDAYERFLKTFNELDTKKQKEVLDFAQFLLQKRENANDKDTTHFLDDDLDLDL